MDEKRSLSAPEISHLYANIQRNAQGKAIFHGFSQVAKENEVSQYFIRGVEIAKKHIFIEPLSGDDPCSLGA